jgi:hypothetical protein
MCRVLMAEFSFGCERFLLYISVLKNEKVHSIILSKIVKDRWSNAGKGC